MIPIKYILKRLAMLLVVVFLAISIVFFLPRMLPANPVDIMLAKLQLKGQFREGGQEFVDKYIQRFGLDKPLREQYVLYFVNLFRGELGLSIQYFPTDVNRIIAGAIPWTIGLSLVTIIFSFLIGTFLGAILGWFEKRTKINWVIASICILINRIPYYIFGLVLVLLLAYYLPIFPAAGGTGFLSLYKGFSLRMLKDILYHATLPALSVIVISIGGQLITMRSLIISLKGEDYIRFAEARGLKRFRILYKYAFRNAMLPVVTGLAIGLGSIFSGLLITEWIFGYPGLGSIYIDAVGNLDFNVIQGCTLFVIIGVSVANFIMDLLYPLVDPRITYEKR